MWSGAISLPTIKCHCHPHLSPCLNIAFFSWLPQTVTAAARTHKHAHRHSQNTACGLWIDNGVPVLTDRCLDGDSPRQGPCPSQQRVHHGHWEVLPLPGVEVILFHGFGHRQLLEQMVDHPENQGKRQHWQARVTLERRDQCFHPSPPLQSPVGHGSACFPSYFPFCNEPLALTDRCTRYVMGVLSRITSCRGRWSSGLIADESLTSYDIARPREGNNWRVFPAQPIPMCRCLSAQQRAVAPLSARLPEEWGWEWWTGSWVGGAAAAALLNYKN